MDPRSRLQTHRLGLGTALAQTQVLQAPAVKLDSPGLTVMTDLAQVKAATTTAETSLAQAEQIMINQGVRLLFVISRMPSVEGLITSTDLRGDRQMQLVHERGVRYDELTVGDVMTPLTRIEAIDYGDMQHASVANVVVTLQALGRNHLLVVDERGRRIRGVISRTQVERQLGIPIAITDVAGNFAEIGQLLS
jgi:CBS domain-containing protein